MKCGVIDETHWKPPLNASNRGLESGKARFVAGKHEHPAVIYREGKRPVRRSVDACDERHQLGASGGVITPVLGHERMNRLAADETLLRQRSHCIDYLEARLRREPPAQASAEYQPIELPVTATHSTASLSIDRKSQRVQA